ncbi:hydroxyacid dehydrogenase [Microbacterium sp. KSW4-11]|uniref:Hydroxyacid dehydrogenase n=1 Tax=Microbacterium gawkjiense TaxID=3067309 RepID=A0ABU3GHC1_9MICO|nr:hydroxyacid dehydrogenase [Microbacterium sp. KSW4-11]MDT3318075.1 hydroxyacid dehydrogenase [Microbacterium sp. KSW4-11]
MNHPRAALLMRPDLPSDLFNATSWERLNRVAHIVDPTPISTWAKARDGGWQTDVEILLTGWGAPRIDEEALENMPKLRAIVHAAGSVKDLISPAAWKRGVVVSTAAEANSIPVAEFTLGCILLALKRSWIAAARLSGIIQGNVPTASSGPEKVGAYNRTIGIIGASRIGRRLVDLLQPYDVAVLVFDPYLTGDDAQRLGAEATDLENLLMRSDIVTLHAPSLPETKHIINSHRLASMRDGATLINTSRGALVDHAALTQEVLAGRLYAVLDVTDPEPLPSEHPLLNAPGAFVTPHIGGALGTEVRRLGDWAVDEVERYTNGVPFAGPVTLDDLSRIA